ncbi:hypothetical protein [Streptomyces justiciae]|uniref:Uncharacterized protein n=1 Tax=Streptomyces justiciae TaxID=2780140 RepID=A0ABU3M8T3_9ACTN|nr:hypothetical protein [Streptomyces justiciae]MDT7847481.1 hypothetical protein [Streptomyces justiciae]
MVGLTWSMVWSGPLDALDGMDLACARARNSPDRIPLHGTQHDDVAAAGFTPRGGAQ